MGKRFGPPIARALRRGRSRAHPQWHLDEMSVSIGGRWMYLWRAIDQNGEALDILVQARRDKRAALKLMRKLLKSMILHHELSSPINGGPMQQRFVIWASTPGITKQNGRTIALKDRTFAFADENERCKAFDLPAQPNISFQFMPPSTAISQRANISSQPPNTDTVVIKLSRHGAPPPTLLPDSLFRWA